MGKSTCLKLAVAVLTIGFGGAAMAQFPQGVQSGASTQASSALATLAIPTVVGVNVAHNFVLDFNSATKCAGASSTQTTYPQSPSAATTYTFAVSSASIPNTANVACPGSGSQPDVATVQVFSTFATGTRLRAQISDGGVGAQATAFTGLIADIFSANRLNLAITAADTCGGGTKVGGGTLALQTAIADQVTSIPKTGWSSCTQKLSLLLNPATVVTAGTATGTLTYTVANP